MVRELIMGQEELALLEALKLMVQMEVMLHQTATVMFLLIIVF